MEAAAERREEGMAATALSHAGDESSGISSCCTVDAILKFQLIFFWKKRDIIRGGLYVDLRKI